MNGTLKKKNTMYFAILSMWLLTVTWFDPRLFGLMAMTDSLIGKTLVVMFVLSLDLFWLFGAYYLMLFLFTNYARRNPYILIPTSKEQPGVAVLYLTMNDFDYEAALSCITQSYEHFHVFILDSSTKLNKRMEVEAFQREFCNQSTIVRRDDRTGYKAGSINNALRNVVTNFPYFAIVDADGVVPSDFLKTLMPYFALDGAIAFVHGNHRPNPHQKTKFADDLGPGLTPLWSVCLGPRNRYGFLPFLGHGGILRRDVWEEIGGFPEIVSEDLAFSTKACERGYRGYFVDSVVSLEDFPATYQQLRKQQEKYIKGGCQYVHKYLFSFLKSKEVCMVEKLDIIMWLATLFIPSIHLSFIILFTIVMSVVLGETRLLTLAIGGADYQLWDAYVLKDGFNAIWTWDFYGMTVLNMFTPLLGCISLAVARPIKLIRLLIFSPVPYFSLMVLCMIGVFNYLLTRKAEFLVTADDTDTVGVYSRVGGMEKVRWLETLNSSHPAVHLLELSVGIILSIACVKTLNIALFAFSISLVLGYMLLRYGWDNRVIKSLASLPFVLLLSAIGLLGMNLVGAQSAFFLYMSLHF